MNPAACKLIAGAFAPVRLGIAEALFIEANAPAINLQAAGFKRTFKLFD